MNKHPTKNRIQTSEAYEIVSFENETPAKILLSCEHASNRLPAPWKWHPHDQYFVKSHWAYDLGARKLTLELANQLHCKALLSRFTRLLLDPNRSEDSETLILQQADDLTIKLNSNLSEEEKQKRINRFYKPYHQAFEELVSVSQAETLLSIHTFTPQIEDNTRDFEIGILFNQHEKLAQHFSNHFEQAGLKTKLNEPYSGKEGFIYSVERVAQKHNRQGIVIEIRNDLTLQKAFRNKLINSIESAKAKLEAHKDDTTRF